MPVLPLTFHYCGVYFQSLCRKPKLKKRQIKKAHALIKNENARGSQESLVSGGDGSESTGTEISSEQSIASTETSGISSEGESMKEKESHSEVDAANEVVDNMDSKLTEEAKKRDLSTNEIVAEMETRQRESHKNNLSKAKIFVIILLVTNIPAAMYFSLIHQRGTILVMKYIHDASLEKNIDVLFLMPCHSTPYYRYVVVECNILKLSSKRKPFPFNHYNLSSEGFL